MVLNIPLENCMRAREEDMSVGRNSVRIQNRKLYKIVVWFHIALDGI